ncbi:MAG: hypothetical protein JXB29_09665 [Sedimentisphaerales bacterium]|nr:hypothetical protein [Sedimentisphaerales bacterium]
MNLPSTAIDNIAELLLTIIQFTQARQKVLSRNINDIDKLGFVPMDLAVDEFSELLHMAINEHTQSQRLLLVDTDHIKFGESGSLDVKPVQDEDAMELFEHNRDEYFEQQISKLMENSLNQRVATELLKDKHGISQAHDWPEIL